MVFRFWLPAALVLSALAVPAHAQVGSATITYKSGANSTGYESASFRARYALHACQGELVITTEFIRSSFNWSGTYWLDGKSYPAPSGLDPVVNDQGTFKGTVRVRGGGSVGSFRSIAGIQSGHGCLGDRSRITDLSRHVDPKDKDAVQRFLASLEVIPDTNPVFTNRDIENAIKRKLADEEREAKRKVEQERKAQEAEDRKRKEEDDRKRKEEDDRKLAEEADKKAEEDATTAQEDEAARKAEQAAAAAKEARDKADREEADRKAARKAKDEQAAAATDWTDADDRDTSGAYWPKSRCQWWDSEGRIHPPRGKHNCDPAYMQQVYATMRQQLEMEREELERQYREEQTRKTIITMGGGTPQGTAVVAGALAMAPLVDAAGEAMNRANDKFPMMIDLEASARVTFGGGTGRSFMLRAPGFFNVHMGFESYDADKWTRTFAYSFGMGIQVPLTRAFTIRAFEIGGAIGSRRHLLRMAEFGGGFHMRTGVVYRAVAGLAFSATLGFDTMGGMDGTFDLGVLWRFDIGNRKKYILQ